MTFLNVAADPPPEVEHFLGVTPGILDTPDKFQQSNFNPVEATEDSNADNAGNSGIPSARQAPVLCCAAPVPHHLLPVYLPASLQGGKPGLIPCGRSPAAQPATCILPPQLPACPWRARLRTHPPSTLAAHALPGSSLDNSWTPGCVQFLGPSCHRCCAKVPEPRPTIQDRSQGDQARHLQLVSRARKGLCRLCS